MKTTRRNFFKGLLVGAGFVAAAPIRTVSSLVQEGVFHLYVDAENGDDRNNGLAPTKRRWSRTGPKKTLAAAMQAIPDVVDFRAKINLAAGEYDFQYDRDMTTYAWVTIQGEDTKTTHVSGNFRPTPRV